MNGIMLLKQWIKTVYVNASYLLIGQFRPKIFCIGLNKTGTTSFHHSLDREWIKIANQREGERLLNSYIEEDFEKIVDFCRGAQAFQDVPFSLPNTYKKLFEAFPNSKFILTVRDNPEQWFNSHVRFASKRVGHLPTLIELKELEYCWKGWSFSYHSSVFGKADRYDDKKSKIEVYERHISDVTEFFRDKPNKLLVLNVADNDSQTKLMEFLGLKSKFNKMPWAKKTI
jgi:hypothetical protein